MLMSIHCKDYKRKKPFFHCSLAYFLCRYIVFSLELMSLRTRQFWQFYNQVRIHTETNDEKLMQSPEEEEEKPEEERMNRIYP